MMFSCIIPAYNEWPRITEVILTALACDDLYEVIVIDDGSSDDTWDRINLIKHPKLHTLRIPKNGGKAHAVITGVSYAKWEYIVMIDADLLHLTPEHITSLIEPVKNQETQISLSLRENSLLLYRLLGTDFVSGERVVPRSLFADAAYYLSGPGFWLEVLMNDKIIQNNYSLKNIYTSGLITPRKSVKYWYIRGMIADFRMVWDVLSIMPMHRLLYQMWYFSRFHSR